MRIFIFVLVPIFFVAVTTTSLNGQMRIQRNVSGTWTPAATQPNSLQKIGSIEDGYIIGYRNGILIWKYDIDNDTYINYNTAGNVTSVTLGEPPVNVIDSLGYTIYTEQSGPAILTYNYDSNHHLVSITNQYGDTTTYNMSAEMVQTNHTFQNYNSNNTPNGNPSTQLIATYSYNSCRQLAYEDHYNVIFYKLCPTDILDHLAYTEHYNSTVDSVAREVYTYSACGGVLRSDSINTISPTNTNQWVMQSETTYSYEWVSQTFNNDNKLAVTATYDTNGHQTDILYDGNNNVIGSNTYDTHRRLVIANYNDISQQKIYKIIYTYGIGANGARLSSMSYIDSTVGGQTVTTIYGYDQWCNQYPQPLSTTGVESPKISPSSFTLEQNFPNPFNPSTAVSFAIPSRSFVTLKVFDVIGREVATIVSEEMSAGSYARQWNAANISSGIYFYRLQAGSLTETKKLILLK